MSQCAERRGPRGADQGSLEPREPQAHRSHWPCSRRKTLKGDPYTPEHKQSHTPGAWMIKEADMTTSVATMKENLQSLCDLYGWQFVDTTTLDTTAIPGPSTPA